MMISPISQINKINNIFNQNKTSKVSFKQEFDTCDFSVLKDVSAKFKQGRHFKFDNYNSLSEVEKEEVLKIVPNFIKEAVDENYSAAKKFKRFLDETYGKDNYIFECIGTSPAGIGRFLEFSGVEVHYLPISGLKSATNINKIEPNAIKKYGEFLSSQGVKKGMDKETDKHILFYDFTYSGDTLRKFRSILDEYYSVPMNRDNPKVDFLSLNGDLDRASKTDAEERELDKYGLKYLLSSTMGNYAGVPHLTLDSLAFVDDKVKENVDFDSRYFNFCMMYKLEQEGLLKENPKNKNSL